jgi:hypothetical protein
VFIVQAYQISQYVVPRGGIFLSKWRSYFAGSSDGKMSVQSACALNTRYTTITTVSYSMQYHNMMTMTERPLTFDLYVDVVDKLNYFSVV